MQYFIGIDLGTTNSVISSFDGENVRVWKSKKDQNDVTPSAIYVDKRGKRFYGKEAYLKSAQQPERCATLFKRYMGTNTKIKLADEELTPEACSAEILRELYKNLPEEIRNSEDTATVITVPAAFNQMQNAATLDAAQQAGFGKVALMQEPVAAIMSIMKEEKKDANFLIYDLGGGTLDVSIAESIGGKVNLLGLGGIAMCGGRDFDRVIMNNVVIPWLKEKYKLPDDLKSNQEYKKLLRIASYQTELAKIELSSEDEVRIEGETGVKDLSGEEIYLDIPLDRSTYNSFIHEMVMQSIEAVRETITKTCLTPYDIDRIVFIGGPTNYKPLRDMVTTEVGIPGSIEVNPMTAVSEGASIYAESIDWTSEEHGRKSSREQVKSDKELGLGFRYEARSTKPQARVAIVLEKKATGFTFEVRSVESGWSSGSMALEDKALVVVPLKKRGNNHFKIEVYDEKGRSVKLEQDTIVIAYTLATVGSILASHSIGIEVRENNDSDATVLDYLVREGEPLPAKGKKKFRAGETIKAGSQASINFKLWEGEVEGDVESNRFIGCMKISGEDFDYGTIFTGTDIICDYVINDSGSIDLEITVPSITESFNSDKNFYSRQEGQVDLDNIAETLNNEGQKTLEKIKDLGSKVNKEIYNEKLQQASEVASTAIGVKQDQEDREELQHINDKLLQIKKMLAKIRMDNLGDIRNKELENLKNGYKNLIEQYATPEDKEQYAKLFETAENMASRQGSGFENILEIIRNKNYNVLQAGSTDFLLYDLKRLLSLPESAYRDSNKLHELSELAIKAAKDEDFDKLRILLDELWALKIIDDRSDMTSNIVKG